MNYEDEFTWLKSLNCGGSNELFARIQSQLKRVVRKDVVHGGLNSSAHIYTLDLENSVAGRETLSVFVKRPNYDNDSAMRVAQLQRWYEREVKIYQIIIPALRARECASENSIRVPQCYFASYNDRTNDFVLILENLLDKQDRFFTVDSVRGMTHSQAVACVRTIARFHKSCLDLQDQFSFLPLMPVHVEYAPLIARSLSSYWAEVKKSYSFVLDRYKSGGIYELSEKISDVYEQYTLELSKSPRTVLHGDYRVGNIMFESNKDDITIFDWQFACRGPGVYDLVYIICFDLSIEDRRKYEANLMQEYFDCLLGGTSDKFNMSKDEFIDDSKKALVLIYASLIIGAATSGKSGIETHTLALDRFAAAIIDWGITIDARHDRDDSHDAGNQAQL